MDERFLEFHTIHTAVHVLIDRADFNSSSFKCVQVLNKVLTHFVCV